MNLPVEKRRQWIRSRREQRKLTKLARLRRQVLRYSILLTLLFVGSLAFMQVPWQLHAHTNKPVIDIKGNLVATAEQIKQTLDSIGDTPIYNLNPQDLRKKVESLSAVKQAFIRRYSMPQPKLIVEILEEFPWATICPDPASPSTFIVAESGKIISIQEFPNIFQPALRIYSKNPDQLKLNSSDVEHWANWTAYIEKQTQSKVLAIDLREIHDVKVETNKCILALGNQDSSLTHRLNRLASVLDILASEHKEPSYVNLGLNSNIPVKLARKTDLAVSSVPN